jgi:hypothetical protein
MAASNEVDELFEEQLRGAQLPQQIIFENDDAEPLNEQDLWIYIVNESDDDDQESIGAGEEGNLWREQGVLKLFVLAPVGSGRKAARLLRDQLADLLKGKQIAAITCRAAHRMGGIVWEGEAKGNWFAFPLHIDWYMDSERTN